MDLISLRWQRNNICKKIVQKHQQKYVSYKTKNITGNLIAYSQEQCNDKYSKNVI